MRALKISTFEQAVSNSVFPTFWFSFFSRISWSISSFVTFFTRIFDIYISIARVSSSFRFKSIYLRMSIFSNMHLSLNLSDKIVLTILHLSYKILMVSFVMTFCIPSSLRMNLSYWISGMHSNRLSCSSRFTWKFLGRVNLLIEWNI